MKEAGYGWYTAAAGSSFALYREGLKEEYEKLHITQEDRLQWNKQLLEDCRKKRKDVSGKQLTTTFYAPASTAQNSMDILLMMETARDVIELYEEVLYKKERTEDRYTLMLTAEYVLNACAERMQETYPDQIREIGKILLALFEKLEAEPLTAGSEYCKNSYLAEKLTPVKLQTRLQDDKWAVRKYLLGEHV